MNHLSIRALEEFPLINPGDNLSSIILDSIEDNDITIDDGDVILLAQKIISKSENRFKNLSEINPSEKAIKLGNSLGRDPAFIQLILDESNEILSTEKNVIIVEHKLGYININAGIDRSNIPKNKDLVLLLPEDPKKSANDIQTQINTQIGKDISVIGGGNSGVEAAIDLAGIVKTVTLFEFSPELNADDILINKLKSLDNVSIITNAKTTKIIGNGEKVTSMEYEDRSNNEIKSLKLEGIFVQIGLVPNSGFIKGLVETNKYGEILVSEKNRTNIDKIYAAGDVTNVPYKQIIIAMGEGAKVGLTAFEDLMIA